MLGNLSLQKVLVRTLKVTPDYNAAKEEVYTTPCALLVSFDKVAAYLSLSMDDLRDTHTTMAAKWKFYDFDFTLTISEKVSRDSTAIL